ncbi:hypothetical protein CEXT_561821 [Caerostris extrusa]|uniref:Uncharacterized protein n=1 Tax=Caerostris extrusa TaxID=172846 RepID=A0AAV4SSK6_CAEEX|nr:hypothetical protein CEXT_561821 [Caerostris extrusa]
MFGKKLRVLLVPTIVCCGTLSSGSILLWKEGLADEIFLKKKENVILPGMPNYQKPGVILGLIHDIYKSQSHDINPLNKHVMETTSKVYGDYLDTFEKFGIDHWQQLIVLKF